MKATLSGLTTARAKRLRRLYAHSQDGLLVTPLDHTLACGPVTPPGWSLDDLVGALVQGGSDAIVVHKGAARHIDPGLLASTSLIVHLNGSTAFAPDPDAKVLLTSVEEALRLGADAVSVHVNLGSDTETEQLTDLATVAAACERWSLPLLAMVYPRGPRVADPGDPELVLRAVTVAADLGADLVKTVQVADATAMREITRQCPIPVLVAGGAPRADDRLLLRDVRRALSAGVGGLAMGRCLFQAADPQRTTAKVAALVHQRPGLITPVTTHHHTEGENHVDIDQAVLA